MGSENKLTKLDKELLKIQWRDIYIDNKSTVYQVSSNGLIFNKETNKILKPYLLPKTGYYDIQLHLDGKIYHRLLHRLVAEAFIPNLENKPIVNHKDGNKQNCCDWNLEWVTNQENIDHAVATGLINNTGINNPNNVYSEEQIIMVCIFLEEGKGVTEISRLLNVDGDTIQKIKSKDVWNHISVEYDIPKPADRIYSSRPKDIRDKIIELLNSGIYNYGEILLKVGLPDIRRNRKYVTNINIELSQKCNVQRLSNHYPSGLNTLGM
jgi:hypothetical protein